ncbi:alpha/beta fold hydrolase [Pyxidicoccus sp. MSG2]|uniref:alpha/beta fold hydrolase n=1 Tax=Pyxidicoccus sp. MSG2 TaxID=2996790 RepID=UPI0022722335|nr:alpha/beta fold hydrolase [Pyxidicoccus sp. MSG2]MCY1023599.1 alpha/beta fold hydrolase [Pyxidicoccus sp. MSG2]
MPYRRSTRFVTAPDGTRVAWHTHQGNLLEDSADTELAERPTVLLTNGIGTSENFWRYIVANLEQDHRVVHWNYRGHGSSENSISGDYRVPVHVDDLERVTEAVMARGNGRPPLHVAFSMGVRVLLELYRKRPDLVPAMTLIAGTPGAPGSGKDSLRARVALSATRGLFRATTPALPLAAPVAHAVMASRFAYPLGRAVGALRARAPRADIDEFMHALRRMSPEAYWYTLRGLAEGHAWDVVGRVRVPTLIIAARDDTLVPLSEVERMRDAMPHAHWMRVDDAGHAGLLEAGTEIADAVRAFLVQHGMEAARPGSPAEPLPG